MSLANIQTWLGHTNIAQTSTYLATTTAGSHDAMRQFDQALGRLTPLDTDGGTPLPEPTPSAEMPDTDPQEHTTKH